MHAVWATPDEIRMVKEVGATISIATTSDMRIGFGLPPVGDFLAVGVPCGISVDTSALIGSSSLFEVMRNVRDAENARTLNEFKLPARRVLELATIEGARSMGIDDKVGSLKPGKRADIIAVSTRALNMGSFVDPAHLLVGPCSKLGSRPRARGLARRDARRSDHVTLMRGAAALAVATNMRAVHFRHEASS